MRKIMVVIFLLANLAYTQETQSQPPAGKMESSAAAPAAPLNVTMAPGTKVLLVLKNSVSSRNAKVGDGIYLESTFPVIVDGRVVIPTGTYVQGRIAGVKRSGRVKGRAELLLHFDTLIYPNGYTVSMPGALESADSSDSQKVKDKEGTVQAEGTKARDAGMIAGTAGAGGIAGASTYGVKGMGIGAGIGGAAGVLAALFTRGGEVRLETGTSVEMVLQRPVEIDLNRVAGDPNFIRYAPARINRMERPAERPTNLGPGLPLSN